ncbi:long-chain-fatty-acid--CoA ligase [Gandjariella thermophila]|uniref:Long-chain-fatty-acid--CoA ligase n=1 Tax=Gandjariella thermophila TaxID=1931992 RepID=A0A4D4IZL0_9PSEU|nr:long-chain fatty acid--CoA ligase [Gandjariella thermophila]GDY29691.1 long-chain-fatty-acid--CoA ligase [Gandjariella thermophila]
MLNLAVMLEDSAREVPDRDAVVLGDQRWSYAEVDAAANRVANLLVECGVGAGDKVAISCPNLPYFPIIYYGILKVGAVVVPLNILLKGREIAYHLDDSEAKVYFCFEGTPDLPVGVHGRAGFEQAAKCEHFFLLTADPHAPSGAVDRTFAEAVRDRPTTFGTALTEPTDTAVILYTSGTTGQPKGAEISHANLVLNALTCHRLFGDHPHDVHLVTLPLFHTFGQTVQMNYGFSARATLVLLPRFDAAAALATMVRERVTFFAGVPTMYWGLLGAGTGDAAVADAARNLRIAVSGGSALPVEIHRRFADRFGVSILEGYGLSETSPVATFNRPDREPRVGSVGLPIWGVAVKLLDAQGDEVTGEGVGEIAIRGHNVMKGYYRRPEATAEVLRDGWFRTGDIGRRDADGYYYIVDRAKDMIIRGGFNVYPRELEEVLLTHPAVSLAAVVGVPHDSHGEEIKAYVVRQPGAEITEAELVAWCRENMAGYKYPRLVEFRDSLPMTATGKILKRELR